MSSTNTPTSSLKESTSAISDRSDTPENTAITELLEALSDSIHDAETFDDAVAALDELTAFLQSMAMEKEKHIRTSVLHTVMENVSQMRRRFLSDNNSVTTEQKELLAAQISDLEAVYVRLCSMKRSSALAHLSELRLNLLRVENDPFRDTKAWAMYRGWYGGAPVTVKRLKMNVADPAAVAWFEKDAQILRRMHHPYIKQYFGFSISENGQPFLVTARYQCSLEDAIHKPASMALRPLTIADKFQIAQQIASAITWLHAYEGYGYIHRNIKPSCVMLNHDYTAFLGDFGFSVRGDTKLEQVRGSLRYMDPRMFVEGAVPDKSGDIYSFTMLLYELFTEQLPLSVFDESTSRQQFVHAMRRLKQELLSDMINRMAVPGLNERKNHEVLSMLRCIIGRGCGLKGTKPVNGEEISALISDCAFKLFSLPSHLLTRYKKLTGNIFLSRISVRDFVVETDKELGTPENKAGKSEYAQCLIKCFFRNKGRDMSISDVQNIARWLPHDDDLLVIAGKKWFFGDYEDGVTREILEEQHMHGHRAFIAIVEKDPTVSQPFLLSFVLPRTVDMNDFPLSPEMASFCSRIGNVASVHVSDITMLASNARVLESKGYVAPVMI